MRINIHTHHVVDEQQIIALVNQYPLEVKLSLPQFSIGIHPWFIQELTWQEELAILETTLLLPNCYAVGECGLDKHITIPMALQEKVLTEQLLLAEKYKKAVILHVVSGFQEIIALKKRLKLTVPLIIHGFSKKPQLAKTLVEHGFYLSFGKTLLSSANVQAAFLQTPKDKVFLETDNSLEITIDEVYRMAIHLEPTIEEVIQKNFESIFKI